MIADVRSSIDDVFDAAANRGFSYTSDVLPEYESQGSSDSFALWKRVAILRGFYSELRERRQVLERRIQEIRTDVDERVPEVSGVRIFPIQALTLPLDFYRKEINFPSDRPNQTIQIGSTALGVQTVGFKLSSGKYRDALDRLNQVQSELNDPGKLVSVFFEALREWESLRKDTVVLSGRLAATLQFFSDADANTKSRFRLPDLEARMAELRGIADEGIMREKTDNREIAGVSAFELAAKLAADVQEVRALPIELRSLLDGVDNSVIVRLQEDCLEKHGGLLKAIQKIRAVELKDPVTLPQKRSTTWGVTVKLFDDVIAQAREEGEAYLPSNGSTTFQDFIMLCEQQDRLSKENRELDWAASPYKEHVPVLMDKKLLRLKLIEVRI